MRFREFIIEDDDKDDNPIRVKITSLLSQLRARYEDSGAKNPYTTKSVLEILRKDGVSLSKDDLYDIIKDDPIKNIISDFDKNIHFKGVGTDKTKSATDNSEKAVKDMAIKATKSM